MARTNRLALSALALEAVLLALACTSVRAQEDKIDREPKSCVFANRIKQTWAIDNRTILFFLSGDQIFRSDMPGICPQLERGDTQLTFNYRTQSVKLTRLCDYDSITVWHKEGLQCRLGKFSQITREEADALIGKTSGAQEAQAGDPAPGADPATQPSNDGGERSAGAEDRNK